MRRSRRPSLVTAIAALLVLPLASACGSDFPRPQAGPSATAPVNGAPSPEQPADTDATRAALDRMPGVLADAQRTPSTDSATYISANGDEFGIEALDSDDISARAPVTIELIANDLRETAACPGLSEDTCVRGVDANGAPVVVWFSEDRATVLAALAPDMSTLQLLLEAWNQART